ncbi:MAG: hypothetical protein B7Z63_06035, partial [Ignavibacteriae bacterium 37-53-5]
KMSKSLGNFVTLKDAFKKFDPITVRFFILQSHYRSPLDYSDEAVEGAGKGLERLKNVMRQLEEMGADPAAKIDFDNLPEEPINLRRYYNEWFAAMADDFNTPSAIAVLFEMFKDINSLIASGAAMTSDFATLLSAYTKNRDSSDKNVETELVNLLIKMRADARKNRDFKLADSIRTELQDIGVMLEDKKDGTTTFKVSK